MAFRIGIKLRGSSRYWAGGGWAGREAVKLLDDENEARCLRDSLGVPCCLVVLSDAKARAA